MDLNAQRKRIKTKVKEIKDLAEKHGQAALTAGAVDVHLRQLDEHKEKLAEVHEGLCLLCTDDAAIKLQNDTTDKVEAIIIDAMIKLFDIKFSFPQPVPAGNANAGNYAKPDIRLPRLEMPSFSGDILDWTSFHDRFEASVGKSTVYTNAQKLQYLMSAVQGPAAELIKSLKLTDANYTVAWDILKKRFDNKRHIINANMDLLYDLKPATSTKGLRHLLDTSRKQFRVLEGLGANTWNAVQVHLVTSRMDSESRRLWLVQNPGTDYPAFADLDKYLEERCQSLEEGGDMDLGKLKLDRNSQLQHYNKGKQGGSRGVHAATLGTAKAPASSSSSRMEKCAACQQNHFLSNCSSFVNCSPHDRKNLVQRNKLCFNCFSSGHAAPQCTSRYSCRKCNARHHTMLHFEESPPTSTQNSTMPKTSSHFGISSVRSVLSTAIVKIKDSTGRAINCRALLDNGSELRFMTEAALQLLGLRRQKSDLYVTGIGGEISGRSRGLVKVELGSTNSSFVTMATLHVLPKLSGYLPQDHIAQDWSHLKDYTLADPEFFKPGKVDILIGADLYFNLLKDRTVKIEGQPAIYETHLGWIVSGSISNSITQRVASHHSTVDIQSQLAKFWELEEVEAEQHLTPEETDCENHFNATHQRDQTGRYVVALPFVKKNLELGASKEQAIRRLQQVERRLAKNPQHRNDYNNFMAEYLSLGHMEEIPAHQHQEKIGQCFYLPHHFVLKETSTSTKFRVVFDGSAKTSSQVSINDKLLIGPRLQRDIFDIVVRFRFYKYGIMADISKFFRQIMVREEDRDFQRILWRDHTAQPIREYRLKTVTYGTASAPYLASRALMQLAEDCKEEFPLASEVVKRDCYVDDVMTGEHTDDAALELQRQLIGLLENGQFPLVKWVSNCPSVLEAVPAEQRETQLPLLLDSEDAVKALGMYWNPAADFFFYKVNLDKDVKTVTKRTLLSDTAKLYDPLGLLSPVLIRAKLLFQSLWKENLGWDDPLPQALKEEWLTLREDLFGLEALQIKRHVIIEKDGDHQLHVFCDASQKAYSAVVYMRSEDSTGQVTTRLASASFTSSVNPVSLRESLSPAPSALSS